ncbi:hypothetical protein O181_113261 [Austropuccinia psidii MF-1]|uniref:DUF4939 domain-containing protein n=1 Tax=Austropuccinia psidii MF-1 TaxID=1389203 RepID=A0A9Q3PU97_9BASI|nr:hypothetical protein [Austropuccinia psidii MF-1]
MPVEHSPPARKTRSQARAQAALTPTPRVPLNGTPAVPQLRAHLDRGSQMEGAAPSRKEGRLPRRSISLSGMVGSFPGLSRTSLKVQGEDDEEEGENSVEEEDSDGTEGVPAPVGASQSTGGPTLAQSDQPVSHQSEPSLLAIMHGTQPFKVRSFLQSCQLIFHNDPASFSQDRKKFLYAISFLVGRAAKWIEPYISNLTNKDSN